MRQVFADVCARSVPALSPMIQDWASILIKTAKYSLPNNSYKKYHHEVPQSKLPND